MQRKVQILPKGRKLLRPPKLPHYNRTHVQGRDSAVRGAIQRSLRAAAARISQTPTPASHRRDAGPERKPTNRDAEFYHTKSVIKRPFCGHGMEKKHVAVARAARRRPDRQAREH
jgi:hypothetical protein